MIRLAICIPVYAHTHAKFTLSMASAIAAFYEAKIVDDDGNDLARAVEIFMVSSSNLPESRTILLGDALKWQATHLLWLDADHVFPRDAILRLLSHGKDVVGANYPRRFTPTSPTACRIDKTEDGEDYKNLVYTTPEKAQAGEVEEVAHLGFGLCLMNMRVLDMLQDEADKTTGNFLPLFEMAAAPDGKGLIGEDVYFFNKCRKAGARIYCDHALSWETGHLYETILTNAHALRQRDEWDAWNLEKLNRYKADSQ